MAMVVLSPDQAKWVYAQRYEASGGTYAGAFLLSWEDAELGFPDSSNPFVRPEDLEKYRAYLSGWQAWREFNQA